MLGAWWPSVEPANGGAGVKEQGLFAPFVRITPDNVVTVVVKHQDKGQGIATGLSTLVAEELDASWAQMKPEFAPADAAVYKNSLRRARDRRLHRDRQLVRAVPQGWRRRACDAVGGGGHSLGCRGRDDHGSNGVITSGTNQATFGDLAADAARLPVPSEVTLKDPKNFVYIGKAFPRLDSVLKTTGARIFTQDVQLDGMLVATLARAPRFGGLLKSVDDSKARAVKGVVDIVKLPQGVAVLAKSTYAAIKGRQALTLTWDDAKSEMRGSDAIIAEYKALAESPGKSRKSRATRRALWPRPRR